MAESSIEWTDATWNPVAGCTVLTAGCTNCYAMRMAARLAALSKELPLLQNVWLGTSVENAEVLERLDDLRATRAAVRFVSFEPLIGSVADADLTDVHWAIVGGESGPRARPISEDWIDEIYERCEDSGTAFFFKQWGGRNKKAAGRTYRGRFWDELPALRM
jgi:protein gp37